MVFSGKVVGGDFMGKEVGTNQKGELVVRNADTVGYIWPVDRKVVPETVREWEEVIAEPNNASNLFGAVGQAVAGAALPGVLGKAASAAVGAGVEAAKRSRIARIEWADEKTSLFRLPQGLFVHLEVVLEDRRAEPVAVPKAVIAPVVEPPLDPAGQVLEQVAGLIKDRRGIQVDVIDQIEELAALRDRGIITEEEFAAKKAELLGRI